MIWSRSSLLRFQNLVTDPNLPVIRAERALCIGAVLAIIGIFLQFVFKVQSIPYLFYFVAFVFLTRAINILNPPQSPHSR